MPAKAGSIVIDITAGTAKMVVDLENAKGKLREFGSSGTSALRGLGDAGHGAVSGVQATSGALRVLEGNMTNNLRASERFIANVLHLGPALQAAFPVVGAIAFGGILFEVGKKVYDFFKNASEGPKKMADAFRELNNPLQITNDELAVSNARLDVEIAKLEGKRQNTLALALAEAKVAADKLGESLEKDLKNIDKILKEQSVGVLRQVFTGQASTSDLEKMNDRVRSSIAAVEDNASLTATEKRTRVVNLLNAALAELAKRATKPLDFSIPSIVGSAVGLGGLSLEDAASRDAATRAMRQNYQGELDHIGDESSNESKTIKKGSLEAGAEAARKYREELKRLQEELAKATEMQLTGLQRVAEEERDETYRLQQAGQLNATTAKLVREIYDAKRLTVYAAEMQKLNGELTKLNGELAEAAKRWQTLSIESSKAFGEFFKTEIEVSTKTLDEHAKAVTKLGAEYNKLTQQTGAQNLQHKVNMVTAGGDHGDPLGALAQQQALQAADIQKRYEGSLVAINSRLAELWREQLRTLSQITGVDQAHVNVEAIGNINLEKANLLRERNLQLLKLDNEMEEKTAEVRQKGVNDFFLDMQGQAQTVGNIFYESMHSGLDQISDQFAKLMTGQKTSFGKMFQDLGEQMLSKSIKSVAMQGLGKLGDAFGIHGLGQKQQHVIVDNMPAAGGIGGGGIGGIGNAAGDGNLLQKLFGGGGGPDANTPTFNPATGGEIYPGQGGSPFTGVSVGGGNWFQKLLGGGGGGPDANTPTFDPATGGEIFPGGAADFGGAMAEGGDVDPGRSYLVGENAPEMFTPRSAGTITPRHKMGGDTHYHFSTTVDARGAELGVENRIHAQIAAAHSSAITGAVRSSDERSKRTPQRKAA